MARPVRHRGKWRIRWIDAKGKRKSGVYDDYNEAAFELKRREVEAEEIRRHPGGAPAADRTMNQLFEYWIENRAPQKRSGDDDESIIKQFRVPFGSMTLRQFIAEHVQLVDAYTRSKQHLAKQTVRNHLMLLNAMLNLAGPGEEGLRWIEQRVKLKKPKVRLFAQGYRWLKSREEIQRFLDAAAVEGPLVFTLYATGAFTGMREGELAALEWPMVDFARRLITVVHSYDGPTKGEEIHYVPILDSLLPLLRAWRLQCPTELVFPNQAGRMHGESSRIFQETLHRVLARAGLSNVMWHGKERSYVTFHGLRHTFASHWVMEGGDIFKLQKILGHQSIELTMRYAHLKPDAFTGDYARFAPYEPAVAKVVEIRAPRP